MPGIRQTYTTNLPLARAVEDDVLLVHTWEGQAAAARARRAGAHDHAEALRVEGREVDPQDRVPRPEPPRILGAARLLEHAPSRGSTIAIRRDDF